LPAVQLWAEGEGLLAWSAQLGDSGFDQGRVRQQTRGLSVEVYFSRLRGGVAAVTGAELLRLPHRNPVLGRGVAEYPANGMKVAHRAGGHSWAENADMSSLKGGEFPLRRKQKGFIC
jgi:hypothetical protein